MRIALYKPDIPQNAGAIMRLCACMDVALDIIEPCGFVLDDKRMRRAGMDYLDALDLTRHASWEAFVAATTGRLVLLTTKGAENYTDFAFAPDDVLLFGRESAGVPDSVHDACPARVKVPLAPGMRSLNVAQTAAMVLGESLRQTNAFP